MGKNNKETYRSWCLKNKDKILSKAKKYRENNKEKIREYDYKYYEKNKERINSRKNNKRKHDVFNLSDNYIKEKMRNLDKTPELIDIKREQLKLYRLLKEFKCH